MIAALLFGIAGVGIFGALLAVLVFMVSVGRAVGYREGFLDGRSGGLDKHQEFGE